MAVDYPQRIDIVPWGNWSAQNLWNSRNPLGGYLGGGSLNSNGTLGNWVEWKPLLKLGTWTAVFHYYTGAGGDFGQVTPKLDGVSLGMIDQSLSPGTNDMVTTIAGIVVATSAVHTLRLEVTGKTSTNYWADIKHITLTRTGA